MMQPEDKIQEIAERAERLQEIGSSILRAGNAVFGWGAEQFFLSDGWSGPWIWNGWKSDVFPAADAGRLI